MISALLIFFVFLVLFFSYDNYPSQFTATATAITNVWSGNCRLACRQDNAAAYSGYSDVSPRMTPKHGNNAPSSSCVCESCPCRLVESVMNRCGPVTTLYTDFTQALFSFLHHIFSMILTSTQGFTSSIQCQVSNTSLPQTSKHLNSLSFPKDTSSVPSNLEEGRTVPEKILNAESKPDSLTISPETIPEAGSSKMASDVTLTPEEVNKEKNEEKDKDDVKVKFTKVRKETAKEYGEPLDPQGKCFKCTEKALTCGKDCPKTYRTDSELKKREPLPDNQKAVEQDSKSGTKGVQDEEKSPKNNVVALTENEPGPATKADATSRDCDPPKSQKPCSSKCTKCIEQGISCEKICPMMKANITGTQEQEKGKEVTENGTRTTSEIDIRVPYSKCDCTQCCKEACAPGCPKTKCGQGPDQETTLDRNLNLSEEIYVPCNKDSKINCLTGNWMPGCSKLQMTSPSSIEDVQNNLKVPNKNELLNDSKKLETLNDRKLDKITKDVPNKKSGDGKEDIRSHEYKKLGAGKGQCAKCAVSVPCISINCPIHNRSDPNTIQRNYSFEFNNVIEPEGTEKESNDARKCSKCGSNSMHASSKSCLKTKPAEESLKPSKLNAKPEVKTAVTSDKEKTTFCNKCLLLGRACMSCLPKKQKQQTNAEPAYELKTIAETASIGSAVSVKIDTVIPQCKKCEHDVPCTTKCPNIIRLETADDFVIEYD